MRRETRDELLLGFLAINAMLREELHALKPTLSKRTAEAKYNPNWAKQPRAPRGTSVGGQWIDAGRRASGAPKQSRRVELPDPQDRPERQRFSLEDDEVRVAENDNDPIRLSLAATRVAPWRLATGLAGSTPLPKTEARQITDDLVLVITETSGRRFAHFERIFRPERSVPLIVFGVDTGLLTTEPAVTERLQVDVALDGDEIVFDATAFRAAYGRDILVAGRPAPSPSFDVAPVTPEERLLRFNLERVGASTEQIALAAQQLRERDSEGDAFVALLRARGATRDRARRILQQVREARRNRPYVPPTSGPLVDIFPELPNASDKSRVFADETALLGTARARSETDTRQLANELVSEIRSLDPRYISPALNDPSLFPRTAEARLAYLDRLQAEHAATLFRLRDETLPLQIATLRFAQRHVDELYPIIEARYDNSEIRGLNRENAIGTALDETLRTELRAFYVSLGLTENDLIRVNRREYLSRRDFRRPDARVANIFFDITIEDKPLGGRQITGFFLSEARPTYVIIVVPRQVGRTFLITPPRRRYP